MVDWVNVFSGLELDDFSEVSVEFFDGGFGFNEIFVVDIGDGFSVSGVEESLLFEVFKGSGVDFGFHLAFDLSLESVGGIDQNSVMLITSNKDGNGVFGLFKERVFEVSVGFGD